MKGTAPLIVNSSSPSNFVFKDPLVVILVSINSSQLGEGFEKVHYGKRTVSSESLTNG